MPARVGRAVAAMLDLSDKDAIVDFIEEELTRDDLPQSEKLCPECGRNFSLLTVSTMEIDCCPHCKSLWFDEGELMTLSGYSKDVPAVDLASRKSKLKCPACGEHMNEYVFQLKSNLLVDKCLKNHGVYLQSGELKRVFTK